MVFDKYGVWKSPSPNAQWPFLTYSAFSGNNQSGTITTSYNGSDIVKVGDYIVLGQGEGLGTLLDVNGLTLQDITIHTGCTGLISWGGGTGDWYYTRVKAIPKPGTSQLIGGSGPQHSFGLGSRVYFDGCEFNGSTDDNLNVYSNDATYFEMKNCKWTNSTVRVMAQGFRTVSVTNNTFTRIGQGLGITMDQVYWNEGNPCYDATITDNTFIQTPYVTYWDYGAIHYGPASGNDRFTNVNIARNTISNGKGRGIYVNNTDSGQISNNVITGMTGAAVTLTNCTNITTPNCTPTTITPYIQINNGAWVQSGNATLALGDTVMFGPQPATGGTWSWTGVNGFTADTRAITLTNIQAAQVGTYVATYINDNGCISTYTFNVALNCTPDPISPQTQINGGAWLATGVATLEAGGTVFFGPNPGWLPGSWSWYGPNGFTASGRSLQLTNVQPEMSGDYVVTFINSGGCSSTYTFNVAITCTQTTITPYIQINNGMWVQSGNATLSAGDTVMFGPQPATGGSWSWTGVNGFTATTRAITLTNIQVAQFGDYVASYTNDNGCISNYTFNVAGTPSLIKTDNTTISSVNNIAEFGLGFYPNPANVFININNAKGADISIFDSLGKVVLKSNCADDLTSLDLTGLFNGFYMIQAQKGKEIVTKKLIITK